jgi:hypothetical protein
MVGDVRLKWAIARILTLYEVWQNRNETDIFIYQSFYFIQTSMLSPSK